MGEDPTPFLSTIAGASAAMVAIIGGLLVARFVSLDSEQQGAQRILNDAKARLATARSRAETAERDLLQEDARRFLHDWDVITAINNGMADLAELRRQGDPTSLTDEQLTPFVEEIREELAHARQVLEDRIPAAADLKLSGWDRLDWDVFRRRAHGLPQIDWDLVWEVVFEQLRERRRADRKKIDKAQAVRYPLIDPFIVEGIDESVAAALAMPRTDWTAIDERRRDDLFAASERAKQHVEDLEGEVHRLRQAHDAIVRPHGLKRGLTILTFFAVGGIVAPVWYLLPGGWTLTPRAGLAVLALFCAGLIVLLGYMVDLARRLSRPRNREQAPDAGQSEASQDSTGSSLDE